MSAINPYLELRQRIIETKFQDSNLGAGKNTAQTKNGSRNLFDVRTVLLEATMKKAGQVEALKQAALSGDRNAQERYQQRKAEFDEQLQQIAEIEKLKTYQYQNDVEQLRKTFLTA